MSGERKRACSRSTRPEKRKASFSGRNHRAKVATRHSRVVAQTRDPPADRPIRLVVLLLARATRRRLDVRRFNFPPLLSPTRSVNDSPRCANPSPSFCLTFRLFRASFPFSRRENHHHRLIATRAQNFLSPFAITAR